VTAARPGAGHRQRGGESVLAVLAIGAAALVLLVYWLVALK
jgi:hypothetical protein